MAITITVSELLSALRMGTTTEETAEATRLLGYASQAVSDYLGTAYEGTPASVVNEAAIRLSGSLFDQPYASRGQGFAASLANSGAGSILLPYRIHRAGSVAAAAAQGAIAAHERAPHNMDGTARTAASAAQARADDAFALADGKVDPAGATSAAREVTADWAEAENPDPIPAPKLVNVINAHEDIVNVLDGRLPGLPVAMRLGWSQTRTFTELDFDRPLPPLGGSVAGLSGGLAAPPFPPGLASDPTLFFGIWLAGDPDVVEIGGGAAQFENKLPLTIDAGKVGGNPGHYVVSTARLRPLEGTIFRVTITGPLIITESDLAAHVRDPDAHHVPPAGMGGGPGEDATARASAATAQTAADTAQAEILAHEATPHNTDITARDDALNARQTAEQAQTAIETHEATPHNTDQTARDAAAAAQMAAEAAAGGRPTVLFEGASVAIGAMAGLIAGNVVCPETGDLEFYCDQVTGIRQGGVAYARIPAARVRGAVSALNATYSNDNVNMLAVPHGANRGIGIAVQTNTNFLLLAAQAPGNFYVRIAHSEIP